MPPGQLVTFADHTGASTQTTWRLFIQNRRNDRAAFNAVAILHSVRNKQTGQQSRPDTAYLKWAGQMGFQKTIFPNDEAELDAFSIRVGQPGVFIHSAADAPRKSIIADVGVCELEYGFFSESFPPISAIVELNYTGPHGAQPVQFSQTSAGLIG